ncbi:FAD-dependent oxidoreductase [Sulfitobacter guttiformis]|uniref:D-amino-acid oxidase n=1 Tax=Sulfitobacter guttiformis TaxID=74349 RepID=A0A420DQH5_9RHOB|nr:FAD-dependent oxidoreductase [Sulfitobacter guttiformis]KIN73904.1 FAD dependent oxidoreductase [Sulfitobacter guttiformis KCTC 32187]RKE96536.1 glycine oxidase [Sulfitobacter guttiformis]
MTDVTILGAGVAGLWAARSCLLRGIRPRLLDRTGAAGRHSCSWWAGGMLAPECEGATAEPPVMRHGRLAASLWQGVTNVYKRGTLVLAPDRDRAELGRFAARTSGHTVCDAAAIASLEPDLEGCHKRGLFFEGEAHLDPRQALTDLADSLEASGVRVEIADLHPRDITGLIIDCRGLAAAESLDGLRGVRGEMIILQTDEVTLNRPVRLLHPRHPLYVVPRAGGLFMLGATQIESEARGPITTRSALELLSAAYALDPRFAEAAIVETGADLRPAFSDNVPRVVRRGQVLHLNGLFRHGYLMAPALAEQAAEFLLTGVRGDLFHED